MPKFSYCLIARNEAKVLPRLMESLKEFQAKGGEVCLLDTGSTDGTADLARSLGCKVKEVGTIYTHQLTFSEVEKINKKFIVDNEPIIVRENNKYFDFASARNDAASMASNDMVSFIDADEVMTKLDIEKIDELIDAGNEQFEYNFVFAHDEYGNPAVEFVQSKFYDRRKVKWVGLVHEVLRGIAKIGFLNNDIFRLEHWQEPGDKHSYLVGLAVDCFNQPKNDRNSHYFARELFWSGRPKSAIKEFENHVTMNGWHSERSESYIFMGDAYGQLNLPEKQAECYSKAFYIDSNRREPLMKLAQFYLYNRNYQAAVCYAKGALEIPWSGFYASQKAYYEQIPHEVLYKAYGWMGRIPEAQEQITKALEFQPYNPEYLRDTKYYFEYYDHDIEGWMRWPELQFLYNLSKTNKTILELGSWAGRSTHALLSGGAQVTAVDTWEGSNDPKDKTATMVKEIPIFEIFQKNTAEFKNLTINRKLSIEAAKDYEDKSFDAVFIDATHTYDEVKLDIETWLPKAKKILCGHDYSPAWPGVMQAVDEKFGKPDSVTDSIWVIDLEKRNV